MAEEVDIFQKYRSNIMQIIYLVYNSVSKSNIIFMLWKPLPLLPRHLVVGAYNI